MTLKKCTWVRRVMPFLYSMLRAGLFFGLANNESLGKFELFVLDDAVDADEVGNHA